jgi:citrate synthase
MVASSHAGTEMLSCAPQGGVHTRPEATVTQDQDINAGLDGVVVAATHISHVDGLAGKLVIAGFPLEAIAPNATFEEMVWLLWNGSLPNAAQLADIRGALSSSRVLPSIALDVLREAAKKKVNAMDALRMAASTLSLSSPSSAPGGAPKEDAMSLVAKFPTIVAAFARLLEGKEPVAPRADLGHVANYLYMMFGEVPPAARVRGLETYVNTVCDHGLNASTFTARVIMSTRSDVISAVVGAIGALKGPLHGGAPGPALDMVFEIREASRAERVIRDMLARGDRLMGFGHRVYKVRDPRADVLSKAAEQFYGSGGDKALYDLAREVEKVALRVLEEHKPGRRLQTNVEYYTALVLHGVGIPVPHFTPTFAIGRVAGWTAHCFEQLKEARIMRPASKYLGQDDRPWVPLEAR